MVGRGSSRSCGGDVVRKGNSLSWGLLKPDNTHTLNLPQLIANFVPQYGASDYSII